MKRILSLILAAALCAPAFADVYNVRDFGAKGDGVTIDSPAINAAIRAASRDGGGVIYLPTGTYASYSIRLASHITIYIEKGATLLAADPKDGVGYDEGEPFGGPEYQDYGHSHWKNSLLWGIGLEDITFCGGGTIDGLGLTPAYADSPIGNGKGNKAIALKECRKVVIKDLTMFRCGHFCLLATGVDNMIIRDVIIDSQRDGLDIDCCYNTVISGCIVNTPWDDGIVLKSSYGLGRFKDTENVTISDCVISGYEMGTMLDNTRQIGHNRPGRDASRKEHDGFGRIKFGTESSGGFKNVTVTNCTFEHCGGFLLESEDGGHLEDVTISNCTMRDCTDSPIFMRLGARMRSPEGTPVGSIKRVLISDINSYDANPEYPILITGIPGYDIQDITIRNVHLNFKGGLSPETALKEVPEREKSYPDPWMFGGAMPSKGMFLRHVDGIVLDGVHFSYNSEDTRPLVVKVDVKDAIFRDITLERKDVTKKASK